MGSLAIAKAETHPPNTQNPPNRAHVTGPDFAGLRYCCGFPAVGLSWPALAAAALDFEVAATSIGLGCQKSAATLAISSGGLLSSGEKRYSVDCVSSTASALTWRNYL